MWEGAYWEAYNLEGPLVERILVHPMNHQSPEVVLSANLPREAVCVL